MELEKSNDVLTNLYTLRGGLSAISVAYDKARRIDNAAYNDLNKVADQYGGTSINMSGDTVSYAAYLTEGDFKRELFKKRDSIKANTREYDDLNNDAKTTAFWNKEIKHRLMWAIILLFGTVALIAGILIWIFVIHKGEQAIEGFLDVIALLFVCLFPLASFIGSMVFFGLANSDKKQLRNSQRDSKRIRGEMQQQNEREIKRAQKEREIIQQHINRLPALYDNVDAIILARDKAIKPLVQSCNVYYRALLEQFSPILDERDWQHLDLVIYELETRRADTIKEALQLVDRELQTERIERTIGEATKAICYTLQRGFAALQQSIQVCCGRICDRLDTISSQLDTVSMQMSVQSMQLAGISEQLTELTDSVNVSNALQAKANVTSAQLCSEVQAMRYYS